MQPVVWPRIQRLADWLDRYRIAVLIGSLVIAAGCALYASRIAIESDLTHLLPSSQRSVRDLKAVQKRARPFGTVQIVVEAPDPATRARAAAAMVERVQQLGPDLVAQFATDDGPLQRYAWQHRFLFADTTDLVDARDALEARIERAKLENNPLYIDLDTDPKPDRDHDRLADLERKLGDLEAKSQHPPQWISKDGLLQVMQVQTTFSASDAPHGRKLLDALRADAAAVQRAAGPGVAIGFTGNVTLTLHEHDSVLEGMAASAIITIVLCALALLWYYRSGRAVLAILWALADGVAATFAFARVAVGHLNLMTAFLFAIVIGNGINAGMILVARYLEEVREGADARDAVGTALAGALRGTAAASATAAIAYGSLIVTDFRGFRHFGLIAGAGMGLTWLATYTVLPALLFILARRGWLAPTVQPPLGDAVARLAPRRPRATLAVGAVLTLIAAVIGARFVIRDPFLKNWRDLQSTTKAINETRALEQHMKDKLDTQSLLSGQAYQVVIAVDQREDVLPFVAKLRADDAKRTPEHRWLKDVRSLDDLLPADQPQKLAILAEIRTMIDSSELQASLSDEDRPRIAKVRPPNDLRALVDADVPQDLAWPFIERDGTRGRLIVLRGARRFDSWKVDDRLAFAGEVRQLALPAGALVAGEPLVVADIIGTMERDAPKMIIFALLGSVLAVIVVLGLRRHAWVTIACGLAGVLVMIASCALAGLKVHFVDLVALPITIGIGIDYAVNLAARDIEDGELGTRYLLRTTGAAVLLCSFTTTVGYATLLLSANGGIRAFGLAALIGELSCVTMALVFGPALLEVLRPRRSHQQLL
jgi:uncharacterized protein